MLFEFYLNNCFISNFSFFKNMFLIKFQFFFFLIFSSTNNDFFFDSIFDLSIFSLVHFHFRNGCGSVKVWPIEESNLALCGRARRKLNFMQRGDIN